MPTIRLVAALAAALLLAVPALPGRAVVVDGIAAVVNGEIVTLLELEKAGRAALEARLSGAPAADQDRVRREVLAPLLDQLVLQRIQAQQARKLGIQVSPQEIDAEVASLLEENRLSEEVLDRLLAERWMTRESYRRELEDQVRLRKLVKREISSRVTVSDEEAAAWFNEHRQEWYRPEKIRIRHLLIPVPPGAPPAEAEAAREKASALLALARGGKDFADIVRAETPGATPDSDAVSGELARGELFPALEAAAFSLPVGGVSEPVQGPAGLHLVQLVARTPPYEPTLAELRLSIEQRISERKAQERYEIWLKKLRADAVVEIRY